MGYQDITVLDNSEASLNKAKQRLGTNASKVKWIVEDATKFKPNQKYDFWHDRAAFHFLTQDSEINNYINIIKENISDQGVSIIGTFSEQCPKKCSGIEIKQYSEDSMTKQLQQFFRKVKCIQVDHKTPFNTLQNFIFCSFKRLVVV